MWTSPSDFWHRPCMAVRTVYSIYKLTFPSTGKAYVGQTTNLKLRMHQHFHKNHAHLPFEQGFTLEVLASALGKVEAVATEAILTVEHGTLEPHGYNKLVGAKHTPLIRALLSKSALARGNLYMTEETIARRNASRIRNRALGLHKMTRIGTRFTEESRLKMSISAKARCAKKKAEREAMMAAVFEAAKEGTLQVAQ